MAIEFSEYSDGFEMVKRYLKYDGFNVIYTVSLKSLGTLGPIRVRRLCKIIRCHACHGFSNCSMSNSHVKPENFEARVTKFGKHSLPLIDLDC